MLSRKRKYPKLFCIILHCKRICRQWFICLITRTLQGSGNRDWAFPTCDHDRPLQHDWWESTAVMQPCIMVFFPVVLGDGVNMNSSCVSSFDEWAQRLEELSRIRSWKRPASLKMIEERGARGSRPISTCWIWHLFLTFESPVSEDYWTRAFTSLDCEILTMFIPNSKLKWQVVFVKKSLNAVS